MAGERMCGGGHAWQGGMCGGGGVHGGGLHAWWGACMAGGMCGGGHVAGGGVRGRYHEIRSMSGRYASYWNAFLFVIFLTRSEMYRIIIRNISNQKSKFCEPIGVHRSLQQS